MELSIYQQGILDFILTGKGNGACNAVAGSGKSTTLKIVAQELEKNGLKPSEIRVIVFGKANSLDLINKFGKGWESSVSTLHSAGWSLLKDNLQIKSSYGLIKVGKYKKIAESLDFIAHRGNQWTGQLKREGAIAKDDDFLKLVDFLRLTNSEPTVENIEELTAHFNIEDIYNPATVAIAAKMMLDEGEHLARFVKGSFDFTDQIWLPVKWGLKPQKPFKVVLVDECQDLNAAQLELALSLAAVDGRLLFVGDPRQAIMGFAGADNESYDKIVQRTNATELPLSVCYRCPKKVINLVKKLYPLIPIEPFDNAIDGEIHQIKATEIHDHLKIGDLILSRKTAPLVSLCIKLISRGIAATVKGKAIGEQIKKDLETIGGLIGFTYDNFNDFLTLYKRSKSERYKGLDNEERLLEDLNDKCEALITIYKSQVNCQSISELGDYIDSLFSDDHSPITLSTAHRAKGLENDRVFIIKPEDMPLEWRNQKSWEYEQECNLHYVALTRAKSELIIVGNCSWFDKEQPTSELIPLEQPQTLIAEPRMLESEQWSGEIFDGSDADTDDQWQCDNCGWWMTQNYDDCYHCGEKRIIDEPKREELEAIATTSTPETIDNSLPEESIDANCERTQLTPFEMGLKVGLSIPLEQLSNDEKRERAIAAIKLNPEMSARAIADEIGVSNYFVSKLKKTLVNNGEILPTQVKDKRGRLLNTENIGATRKTPIKDKVKALFYEEEPTKEDVAELIEFLKNYL